jgi:hypothetical protein
MTGLLQVRGASREPGAASTAAQGLSGRPPALSTAAPGQAHNRAPHGRLPTNIRRRSRPASTPPTSPLAPAHAPPVQSLFVAACLGLTPAIKLIPTAVLWGYFAFMGLESLPGNQVRRQRGPERRPYRPLPVRHPLTRALCRRHPTLLPPLCTPCLLPTPPAARTSSGSGCCCWRRTPSAALLSWSSPTRPTCSSCPSAPSRRSPRCSCCCSRACGRSPRLAGCDTGAAGCGGGRRGQGVGTGGLMFCLTHCKRAALAAEATGAAARDAAACFGARTRLRAPRAHSWLTNRRACWTPRPLLPR